MAIQGKLVLILFVGLFLCSCDHREKSEGDNDATITNNSNSDISANPVMKDPVTGYIQLKDALIASDNEATKAAGIEFKSSVTGNVEAAFEKAMLSVTDKIIISTDIEEQRKHFEQVSELMYALAQNGQFEGKRLYKQFCPMAFNNKGAFWLSLDENILNPYFGERMLRCGYVEEVL